MRQVRKYDVPVDDQAHAVEVPGTLSVPVHVACQNGPDVVQVWFLVDPRFPPVEHSLRVFGTGQPIPDGAAWMGTALAAGGALVWHLFDVGFQYPRSSHAALDQGTP